MSDWFSLFLLLWSAASSLDIFGHVIKWTQTVTSLTWMQFDTGNYPWSVSSLTNILCVETFLSIFCLLIVSLCGNFHEVKWWETSRQKEREQRLKVWASPPEVLWSGRFSWAEMSDGRKLNSSSRSDDSCSLAWWLLTGLGEVRAGVLRDGLSSAENVWCLC